MTISTTYSPDTYAGDGATTTFAITFAFLSVSTNVKVSIKVDSTSVITTKTAGTHYNISGSNVVFTAGNIPASGETVIIELNPDFKQTSDYTENSAFPAETLETDLDERTLESQYVSDLVTRSVKVDPTVNLSTFSAVLPDAVNNGILGFNSDSTGLAVLTLSALNSVTITGSTTNGLLTYDAANQLVVESNATFSGSALTITGNIGTSGSIVDSNGNESITIVATASAVNELTVTNAATGNAPSITATGGDTNIGLTIDPKGTGTLTLGSADATVAIASTMTVIDEIQHAGDTNNKIGFTTDTQTFTTGGSTRMDITDSGIQLGGSGARVTTILDEDTMSSDSATALATQQSIKAYVDAQGGGASAATQAELEAATSTTVYTSPGRQQYHPSAAKCWVAFTTVTTTTINDSYNVTSLTDNGSGDTTVVIATDFSSINYAVAVSAGDGSGTAYFSSPHEAAPTAGTFRVRSFTFGGGVDTDVPYTSAIAFGDQ